MREREKGERDPAQKKREEKEKERRRGKKRDLLIFSERSKLETSKKWPHLSIITTINPRTTLRKKREKE